MGMIVWTLDFPIIKLEAFVSGKIISEKAND
jgi:hypothetical protein